MYSSKKYVVLADIESVRISYKTFAKALNELSNYGEIAACKFYGYSSKRSKDYDEFIRENNFDALSALPKKKRGRLDLRQVIDAVRLAQFPNIDGFFLIYGQGDITPLIAYLKSYGMDVIAGVIEPDKNAALCNKVILLGGEEPIVKDVLKKGYKQVAPSELVYVDNEPENTVDEKVIEKALNEVVPSVTENKTEQQPTEEEIRKLEDETMAQVDKIISEINAENNEPSSDELSTEIQTDTFDAEKDTEDYIDETNESFDDDKIASDDSSEDDDEYEPVNLDEVQEADATSGDDSENIDDDALIAQLYKLLGGLD
ncbi:MAG: NYN domain-containing protein [Christensenellales bacterium]